jgi:hypothetical protein
MTGPSTSFFFSERYANGAAALGRTPRSLGAAFAEWPDAMVPAGRA